MKCLSFFTGKDENCPTHHRISSSSAWGRVPWGGSSLAQPPPGRWKPEPLLSCGEPTRDLANQMLRFIQYVRHSQGIKVKDALSTSKGQASESYKEARTRKYESIRRLLLLYNVRPSEVCTWCGGLQTWQWAPRFTCFRLPQRLPTLNSFMSLSGELTARERQTINQLSAVVPGTKEVPTVNTAAWERNCTVTEDGSAAGELAWQAQKHRVQQEQCPVGGMASVFLSGHDASTHGWSVACSICLLSLSCPGEPPSAGAPAVPKRWWWVLTTYRRPDSNWEIWKSDTWSSGRGRGGQAERFSCVCRFCHKAADLNYHTLPSLGASWRKPVKLLLKHYFLSYLRRKRR